LGAMLPNKYLGAGNAPKSKHQVGAREESENRSAGWGGIWGGVSPTLAE